jgi:hypothetical protein
MKKIRLILTVVFITALIGACTMVPWDEIVSLNISPTLIKKTPKVYPGGNADCSTINIPGLVQTTGRNNYVPSTDSFENGWPAGLLVKVEYDKSVSFQIDGAINLGDGKCYKVGAVIVKGSDASNVYDYTDIDGATMDKGLVPPNNASGSPAGLSNLTFCFVECPEPPQKVIAFKGLYDMNYSFNWACTGGGAEWNNFIGYHNLIADSSYKIWWYGKEFGEIPVGNLTIKDIDNDGKLEVIVDNSDKPDFLYTVSYLFIGTPAEFNTNYESYPYVIIKPYYNSPSTVIFELPY